MGWNIALPILIFVLGGLLVSAGIQDARTREIANWKNAAVALLAPVWWYANGLDPWPDMALQIGVATAVFALFLVAFHFGMMGGGDVKLLVGVAGWSGLAGLGSVMLAISVAGGMLAVVLVLARGAAKMFASTPMPRVLQGGAPLPYAVAIAAGCLGSAVVTAA